MTYGLGLFVGSLSTCSRHIIVRHTAHNSNSNVFWVENVFVWSGLCRPILDVSLLVYGTPRLFTLLGLPPPPWLLHELCCEGGATNQIPSCEQAYFWAIDVAASEPRKSKWLVKNVNKLLKRFMGVAEVTPIWLLLFFSPFPREG